MMQTNTITWSISRETALDHGLVEPTEEDRSAAADRTREYHRHRAIEWDAVEREVPVLQALTEDPKCGAAVRVVLDLHDCERDERGVPVPWARCGTCYRGGDDDHMEWPCVTVTTLVQALIGVTLTEVPYSARAPFGPIRDPLPWPREPLARPQSFVDLTDVEP